MTKCHHQAKINFLVIAIMFAAMTPCATSLSILTFQNKDYVLGAETEKDWGEWSGWQPCSRSCGGGVTHMRRQCLKLRSYETSGCVGPNRMYSSCNIQDCPEGSVDFRWEQCSSYNNRTYGGRTYAWQPYIGESVLNPCELHCQAENASFINKLSSTVVDGTKCNSNSYDVCVDGACQDVGCDMMLGSKLKEDKCLECGGDGSSCFRVNGVFRASNLPTGYVEVIIIPAGATNIEIVDYRAPRNFLAIRSLSGGYALNGNGTIGGSGVHQVAGTKLIYRRRLDRKNAPESIRILGPTKEEIRVELFVQERNKGIRYRFYLPREAKNPNGVDVEWRASAWSNCTRQCNGGIQHRRINCVKNDVNVPSYLCHSLQRPTRRQRCNVSPCVARWQTLNWTECSASCNGGVRFRQVYCTETSAMERSSLRLVPDERCHMEDKAKPSSKERCNENSCSGWIVGNWSSCSTSCGVGQEIRSVTCRAGFICSSNTVPERVRDCNTGPCSGIAWVVTAWSMCTESCGRGMQTRLVRCVSKLGAMYDDSLCQGIQRPATNQTCHSTSGCSVSLQWMTGEWSECSAKCGSGMQTRKVVCSVLDPNGHRMFPDEHCAAQGTKPTFMRNCTMPQCAPLWFKGPWSTCSEICGGGRRSRLVMCLSDSSPTPHEEFDCDETSRPNEGEECNTVQCPSTTLQPLSVDQDPPVVECYQSVYGCCPDRRTPAQGWLMEGCPGVHLDETDSPACSSARYGCCRNRIQSAEGPNYYGCPEYGPCYASQDRGEYCLEWVARFYYDPVESRCKHFWYGGCGGNENKYLSREACEDRCGEGNTTNEAVTSSSSSDVIAPTTTLSTNEESNTVATRSKESHTTSTSSSTLFASGTSSTTFTSTTVGPEATPQTVLLPAVADNESTLWLGPKSRILSVYECSLAPNKGPCFRRLHRWYYDPLDHTCKTFIFSGCASNPNNFQTRDECLSACFRETHTTETPRAKTFSKCELDQNLAAFEEKQPPKCDPKTGKYRPLQCMSDINGVTLSCWCVDPDSGVEIDGSRRYGSIAPDCNSPVSAQTPSPSNPCSRSAYGCCPDGATPALGHGKKGCSVSLRIKTGRSVVYTRPGGSASLSCPAVGYPKPRVRWFKDGNPVETSGLESRVVRNGYNLIFTSVQPRHLGSYLCEATNGVNLKQRKTVRLVLTEERLRFRTKPANTAVRIGSSTHLKCRIRGDRGSVTWLKNGRSLLPSEHVTIKPWGDLRIDKTLLSDRGDYTCVANNANERLSSSATITVYEEENAETSRSKPRRVTTAVSATTTQPQFPFLCVDKPNLADCPLVAAAGMCAKAQYRNLCCATCRQSYTENTGNVNARLVP